jgi:hypothetical protein
VHLDELREHVDGARILVVVRDLRALAHLLDHDEQIAIGFVDHFPHRRVRRGLHDAGEIRALHRMGRRILADHAHPLGNRIERFKYLFGKAVKELVQIAEQRTVRLPVVVLVVEVEDHRVCHLVAQALHNGALRRVFRRDFARDGFRVGRRGL